MDDQDMGRNDHFADGATGLMQGTNPQHQGFSGY